eukprot:TRINITY_DN1670_c0_g1_i14.p1 TRINITY_DN1670_c0_g1~~TRINITY_DN1670_c0_g1_i14.p1  ORF type:complete len:133 (+),score=18.84 TRINITY_DN1670_c0_g1_i14:365-763(+)
MFLTQSVNIKEVLLFPAMKPTDNKEDKDKPKAPGALGDVKPHDEDSQLALNRVLSNVQERFPAVLSSVPHVVGYKVQVVKGKNFFIKVRFQSLAKPPKPDQYIHLRVYRNLDGGYTLADVKEATKEAPIDYF